MTRKNLFLNFAFFIGAMLLFVSCLEDSANSSDDNFYTPPAGLRQSEIIELIKNANQTLSEENAITCTKNMKDRTNKEKTVFALDIHAKKELSAVYDLISSSGKIKNFKYAEETTLYRYNYDEIKSNRRMITDAYFSRYQSQDSVMNGHFIDNSETYKWAVDGVKIVGKKEYSNAYYSEKSTLTLLFAKDKRFRSGTIENSYVYGGGRSDGDTTEFAITYTANPALPGGFKTADFTAIKQYSLTVLWGNGLNNTFYSSWIDDQGRGRIDIYDKNGVVLLYAPVLAAKKEWVFYKNAAFTDKITDVRLLYLTDNNTVLYAKQE